MKLCKNYVEGLSCPFNEKCPYDHIDIRNLVRCEIDAQLQGNQWPLSCFGPFINKPSLPNYIEDQSFEEIRMMYYDSNTSFIYSAQKLSKAMKEAENKMETLISMNMEVLEKITNIYNCTESLKEAKNLQDPQSVRSPFGKSNETKAVGNPVISPFGKNIANNTVQPLVTEKAPIANVIKSIFANPQYQKMGISTDLEAQKPKAPFFGIPQQNKDLQLQKKNQYGFRLFDVPNQRKEQNFGALQPQERKEQSLAQHQQPKTDLCCLFTGPSPHKPQDIQSVFGVLGTNKKPLEQSEHNFGFFSIAEPEKRQQSEINHSVFGVPKAQEQNKFSFGFFTSPEQQKQKNTENYFGFLKPPTKELSATAQPFQLVYPSLFGFPTSQPKQNQQMTSSVYVPQTQQQIEHSSSSAVPPTDNLLKEAIRRNNPKSDNVENKTTFRANVPLLVIKPKARQTSAQTETEMQDKIDPVDLSAQIDSISKSFEGSIVIKCSNEESIKALQTEVDKKCSTDYDVEVFHHAKDPQIVVSGIDNQVNSYKLVEIIRKQNKLNGKLNFIKAFEEDGNTSKFSAVIEVDKNLYKEIMKRNDPNFYIGWNKCFVQDNFNIGRCFSCWGFNHTAKNCSNSDKPFGADQLSFTIRDPAI